MADETKQVEKLLESHSSLKITKNKEGKCRVVCERTSHEMPCTLKAVQAYINGKKYKYETENKLTTEEQELHTQYLVLKRRGQLYCTLTKRYINNLPHHIKLHFKGRRFQKAHRNVQNLNLSQEKTSNKEEKEVQGDKDESMWVPSESESESPENDGLGSDFEAEETQKTDSAEESYSFNILDTKDCPVDLQVETISDTKPKQKRKSKQETGGNRKRQKTKTR